MPPFADVYVLTSERTAAKISAFLDQFAPVRHESAEDYCIPQYADSPHTIFQTAAEVIDYCCRQKSEAQSIYWRLADDGDPAHAMVFFTSDGYLILGLSTDESTAEKHFAELRMHTGSEVGYCTVESPPPSTSKEFRQFVDGLSG